MPANMDELRDLYNRMINELGTWKPLWQEIGDYMVPWRNMITTRSSPGTKLTDRIYDATAPQALTTAASAIQSSVTPDNLRWFSFTLGDRELLQQDEVLPWLDDLANKVYHAITNSNFSAEVQELYSDLLAFGTGLMLVEEEPMQQAGRFAGVRFHTQQPGTFAIMEGADGRVDTAVREIPMRIGAVIKRWGIDTVSEDTAKLFKGGKSEDMLRILHIVYPRTNSRTGALAPRERRIASVWAEVCASASSQPGMPGQAGKLQLLEEKGMPEMPIMAPRWRKISGETYGRSPGMLVLPDVRTLNQAVELRLKAWTLAVAPPIITPDRGVVGQIRLTPYGRINVRPGVKLETLNIPSNFDVANFSEDRLQTAIKAGFFVDLLQFQSKAGTPISATEASIRFQTMQKILGPVVSRLHPELLAPVVQRVLNLMQRGGALPEPPPALAGIDVSLELIFEGPLSRVQRMADIDSINQFMSLMFPVAEVLPNVISRLDEDEFVETLAYATALPAHLLRSREAAQIMRDEAKKKAEQQQQLQNMVDLAPIIKEGAQIAKTPRALTAFNRAGEQAR